MTFSGRSSLIARRIAVSLMLLSVTGCDLFGERGPVRVAAIGPLNIAANPYNGQLSPANAALLNMTSQGLVSYDAEGQIDVGLAERWTVTADGLSYIFRLREAKWSNGRKVLAADVANILQSYLSVRSKHVMKADFPEVESIKAMTDTVVEIRLAAPQPAVLELLAHPAMSIVNKGMGWGPMRVARGQGAVLLTPVPDPLEDEAAELQGENVGSIPIELTGTPAPRALARFKNGYADAVIGGRFSTLPYFISTKIARARLIVDPTPGLFGFSFVGTDGFLARDSHREAISRVIRRQRVIDAFGLTEWPTQTTLRPSALLREGSPAPLPPSWAEYDDESRFIQSKRVVDAWIASGRTIDAVRIAVPSDPGGRILYAYVAADLNRIGVPTTRVEMKDPADLRLIDQVMPNDDPLWALRRLSCRPDTLCNSEAQSLIARAGASSDPAERLRLMEEAETVLIRFSPFIPLATPLRWSVASPRLTGLRANSRGQHPLNRLLAPPK